MDFRLTEDQEALRRGIRELLEARFDGDALRRAAGSGDGSGDGVGGGSGDGDRAGRGGGGAGVGLDRALWRELGGTGLFSLVLPESAGGVGLGLPEAVLAFEETGRVLLPGPLVACHLAAGCRVPGAADGSTVVTVADLGPGAGAGAGPGTGVGTGTGTGAGRSAGPVCGPVEHLAEAGRVLALEGAAVRVLAPEALDARPVRPVDPLTPLHRVRGLLPGDAPEGLRPPREASQVPGADAERLRAEGALLTAAQQLGSAGRTVELAVAHARRREQFGQPIGAFQAVKHLCAQMLVRAETARSVVYAAAVTEDGSEIAAAKLLADEAAVRNARDCLQVHGGMGFTWEADVHLHLKRAWSRAGQWQSVATGEEKLAAVL